MALALKRSAAPVTTAAQRRVALELERKAATAKIIELEAEGIRPSEASDAASDCCACWTLVSAEMTAARAFCTSEMAACALAACASAEDSSCVGSTRTSGWPVVTWSPGLTLISVMRP